MANFDYACVCTVAGGRFFIARLLDAPSIRLLSTFNLANTFLCVKLIAEVHFIPTSPELTLIPHVRVVIITLVIWTF